MAVNNIWVFAQVANGAPTTFTLELLAKARTLGGSVTAFVGGDGAAVAGALGEHGASKVYATGDLGGKATGPGRKKAATDGTRKAAVKYRDASGNTWSGRGLQPRWLKEALAKGKSLSDFSA